MKKFALWVTALAVVLATVLFATQMNSSAVEVVPGSSADNPIVVTDPNQVPSGAVETGKTKNDCATTTTWTLTVPGNDETSHQEFRYMREVPAVQETSHLEWSVEERTRSLDTVTDYITQYHFRKFTQTRERTYTPSQDAVDHWWNWSPNNSQGPQDYTPGFPTDEGPDGRPRGTWQGPHVNGGPLQDTFGTFQTGEGNSPFFHREHISDAVAGGWGPWGDYGTWTPWEPETHTSWESSDAPLGSPEAHGSGQNGNVQWERVWQARFDGQTRQVEIGTHNVFGEWSNWQDQAVHLLELPNPPLNNDLHEWRINGPLKVVDVQAVDGFTLYYVLGGLPSLNEEDASWILAEQAPEGWTQFDERSVSNQDGTPTVVTYYSYNDGVKCEPPVEPPVPPVPPVTPPKEPKPPVTPPVPPVTPPTEPGVPTLIDAGL